MSGSEIPGSYSTHFLVYELGERRSMLAKFQIYRPSDLLLQAGGMNKDDLGIGSYFDISNVSVISTET